MVPVVPFCSASWNVIVWVITGLYQSSSNLKFINP